MGGSQSAPFNYDQQLLGDTSHKYTVEVKSDGTDAGNCGPARRSVIAPDRLISIPFEEEVKAGKRKRNS